MKTLNVKRTVFPPEKITINEWYCYIREKIIELQTKNNNQYSKN